MCSPYSTVRSILTEVHYGKVFYSGEKDKTYLSYGGNIGGANKQQRAAIERQIKLGRIQVATKPAHANGYLYWHMTLTEKGKAHINV